MQESTKHTLFRTLMLPLELVVALILWAILGVLWVTDRIPEKTKEKIAYHSRIFGYGLAGMLVFGGPIALFCFLVVRYPSTVPITAFLLFTLFIGHIVDVVKNK